MHNLIIDKIKLNNNINDHFEDLHRRERHIFEESERNTNNDFFGNFNNEKSLEKKIKFLINNWFIYIGYIVQNFINRKISN